MKKTIDFNGYNVAEIVKRYPNGDCLCNVYAVVKKDKFDQIIKYDTNIVFTGDNLPFDLTEEEIISLKPVYDNNLY